LRFKRPIYRYLFYTAWLAAVAGVITLLVSANSKAKTRTCKGVEVTINNDGQRIFVEKEGVLKELQKTAGGSLQTKNVGDINLAALEKALEQHAWISDAQMYFDTRDVLHVSVHERVPVARVFTTAENSFYIDSSGYTLPLLESYSARLPVLTGFTPVKRMSAADSSFLAEVKEVVRTVGNDPFWNAQVGQIDITPGRKFELIPVIGSHVIRLGSGTDVAAKLARLMIFYRQVLPKAGLAKYSALDAQYEGQVVAVKRGVVSKVDSIQLQRNIEELMKKKLAEQEPENFVQTPAAEAPMSNGDFGPEPETKDTAAAKPVSEKSTVSATKVATATAAPAKEAASAPKSNPLKTTPAPASKPIEKRKVESKGARPQPKAVMPRKVDNEY
jgi:cell division protein FtsQ